MTQPPIPPRTGGRVNIAFTLEASEAAQRFADRFSFASRVEVARIAAAFALRENLSLVRPDNFGPIDGSNYGVASVDPGGELRDLLLALHPEIDEDPYRAIETLMSVGAIELDKRVATGEILSLRDVISPR